MDITIKTTCQICGREIKAKSGVIAHHGYTRPGYGWQSASCLGAKYAPYEVSNGRISEVIGIVEEFIATTVKRLASFKANPPEELTFLDHRKKLHIYAKPEGFTLADIDGVTAMHSYASYYQNQVRELERSIKGSKITLEFLRERLEKWEYKGYC